MLVAAAVLPHPPLLVPEVASGAAEELDSLRSDCSRAIARVTGQAPDVLVLVGDGPARSRFAAGSTGSLAGFGISTSVKLVGKGLAESALAEATESCEGGQLPMSLAIGAWLLARAGWNGHTAACAFPNTTRPSDAAAVGRRLALLAPRVAIVALGDGSAALSQKAPGYVVPGAAEWQAQLTTALANADCAAVLAADSEEARRFAAVGLTAWQVVAGAAVDQSWSPMLHSARAPYGVAYVVASWVGSDV